MSVASRAEDDHHLPGLDVRIGVAGIRIEPPLEHGARDVHRARNDSLAAPFVARAQVDDCSSVLHSLERAAGFQPRRDAAHLLSAPRETSKSAAARELILDVLEDSPGTQMQSDALDALVHKQTGLAVQTIKNVRGKLRTAGLIKSVPEKDDTTSSTTRLARPRSASGTAS